MKKIVSLLLVLGLCFSAVALGEDTAALSKTMADLITVEVAFENPISGSEDALIVLFPSLTEEEKGRYAEELRIGEEQLRLLEEAESPVVYFGALRDPEGNPATMEKQLGTDNVDVNEFFLIVIGNYRPEYGDATLKMELPTQYREDDKFAVMIGIVTTDENGNQQVDWVIYPARSVIGDHGQNQVEVTLKPDILMAVQDNIGLMAVVKAANVELDNDVTDSDGGLINPVSEPTEEELVRYTDELVATELEANKVSAS